MQVRVLSGWRCRWTTAQPNLPIWVLLELGASRHAASFNTTLLPAMERSISAGTRSSAWRGAGTSCGGMAEKGNLEEEQLRVQRGFEDAHRAD